VERDGVVVIVSSVSKTRCRMRIHKSDNEDGCPSTKDAVEEVVVALSGCVSVRRVRLERFCSRWYRATACSSGAAVALGFVGSLTRGAVKLPRRPEMIGWLEPNNVNKKISSGFKAY
jgi:hypothetical protein